MRGIDVGVGNGNGMGREAIKKENCMETANRLGKEKKAWERVNGMGRVDGMGDGKRHGRA